MALPVFQLITILCVLITAQNAQELKTVVRGHLDSAVRDTKVGLGIATELKGETVYNPSPDLAKSGAKNLTFIISGKNFPALINPFIKISYHAKDASDNSAGSFGQIGSTETAGEGVTTPEFTQTFWFLHRKGAGQVWKFRLFDHKNEDKMIAESELNVDDYAERQVKDLEFSNNSGNLTIHRTTPVRFKLSAKNIKRADEFNGKSDAYVKVYYRTGQDGKDTKFATTTTIDNVENADWGDVIEFSNYIPLRNQWLHFKLRDADSWTRDDHLGEVLVMADAVFDMKLPQTVYLEQSGERSTITILPVK